MHDRESTTLRLLGGWQLTIHGTCPVVGPRQQRLIAALALLGQRPRSALRGLLWPDCTDARAMGSLRAAVFTVSHQLPGLITSHGPDLALASMVDIDLHRIRSTLVNASSTDPLTTGFWLDTPSSVDLLPGWYEDWVVAEQERLQHRYLNAAEQLAGLALDHHDHHGAVHHAQLVLELDPLRESAVRILIETHLAAGNRATALQVCHQYTERLKFELNLAPSKQFLAKIAAAFRD